MIDPLNNSLSPYHILGVSLHADKNEIIMAFKRALGLNEYNQQQIANARKTLLDLEMRLQEDFFLYDLENEKEPNIQVASKKRVEIVLDVDELNIIDQFDNLDLQILQEDL